MEERDFDLASRAARAMNNVDNAALGAGEASGSLSGGPDDGISVETALCLADVAIARGVPAEAIILLKSRTDRESRSKLAWTFFCMNQYAAATDLWLESSSKEEALLGKALSLNVRQRPAQEIFPLLKKLSLCEHKIVSAAAAKLFAELLANGGDKKKSLTWARRAEWLMPFDLSLKRLVANAAAAGGNRPLSFSRWKDILAISPEDAEAHEMLGHAAIEAGNSDVAIDHFARALAADPFRPNIRVLLGDVASDAGRIDEAVEHWETACRIDPRDKQAMSRLAEIAWDDGDIADALHLYLKLQKQGLDKEEEEETLEIIGYLFSETLLGGNKKYEIEAMNFFVEARAKYPSNPFLKIYEARRLISINEFAQAHSLIKSVLANAPMMPEAVFELGNLMLLENDSAGGMTLLLKAAQLDNDPFYKKELGKNYLELDDWTSAEKWFKKALSSGTEDEEILLGLYLAVFNQRKYALSENILRRSLALSPENIQAQAYLAETLIFLRKYEDAHALMEIVAASAITADQFARGDGVIEKVVEPPGVIHWLMGFACALTGREKSANENFTKARQIAPQIANWFDDLKTLLESEMASNKKLSKQMRSVIIFQE